MLTEGEKVKEFEEKLQQYIGCKHRPLTTNSCTSALQLAYRSVGVKNKLVLATPMTCTATNMPILAEGGKIVWCDVDPSTGNISVEDAERKLEKYGDRVVAISFVDFAGYPADLNGLIYLKNKHGIELVEDAAQSIGARYMIGNSSSLFEPMYMIGSISDINYVCLSFQAVKHLQTADGGALICNDESKWSFSKKLKWYGINRESVKEATRWHYDIPDWGYKFHMNNVNATIGISQLDYIRQIIAVHKENGFYFQRALEGIDGLEQLKISDNSEPSFWIYMIKVKQRDNFAKMMQSAGIMVNVAHIRNDSYSCFKDKSLVENVNEELPGLQEFNDSYLAIPCGSWVSREDREYIVETIKKGW